MDSAGKKAGKGPLIAEEISHTLGTSQDQYLFQAVGVDRYNQATTGNVIPTLQAANGMSGNNKPCVAYGVTTKGNGDAFISEERHTSLSCGGGEPGQGYPCVMTFEPGIASRDGGHVYEGVSGTLRARPGDNQMTVAYDIGEARLRTPQEYIEKSPTITARCGTGGNNVPAVVFENHAQDSRYKGPLKVAQPVTATYGMGGNNQPLVICLQGNGIDRADTAGCNGGCVERNGVERDVVAVVYRANAYDELEQTEKGATLKACGGNYGGGSENLCVERKRKATEMNNQEENNYIVRRLTPLECNRLQGFPDGWGEIDHKDDFTDEEYRFWLEVRNTFAEINGKQVKDYTKEQMLKWYNKLHTDSAEYKMWGNGIALPCAIHVMQGIVRETGGQHEKGLHTLQADKKRVYRRDQKRVLHTE